MTMNTSKTYRIGNK